METPIFEIMKCPSDCNNDCVCTTGIFISTILPVLVIKYKAQNFCCFIIVSRMFPS